jgi:hypothetical protein
MPCGTAIVGICMEITVVAGLVTGAATAGRAVGKTCMLDSLTCCGSRYCAARAWKTDIQYINRYYQNYLWDRYIDDLYYCACLD